MYICSSFCSELRETEGQACLLPVLPSLLSCLCTMATDSPDIVLLVVVDTLQLVAKVCLVLATTVQMSMQLVCRWMIW